MADANIEDELIRTAYHEAGHTVLHLFLALGCNGVTIEPDSIAMNLGSAAHGGFGQYGTNFGEKDDDIANLRTYAEEAFYIRQAIACYGGAEATRRWNTERDDWRDGAESDDAAADDFLDMCSTGDEEAFRHLVGYTHRRTELLIEHYWPEIRAVADRLVTARKLEGEEVRQICMASLKARCGGLMSW